MSFDLKVSEQLNDFENYLINLLQTYIANFKWNKIPKYVYSISHNFFETEISIIFTIVIANSMIVLTI